MLQFLKLISVPALSIYLVGSSLVVAKTSEQEDLSKKSFDEILSSYTLVADFAVKEAIREVSDELFWRYPYPLPKAIFPIEHNIGDKPEELPSTKGALRPVQHMNYGRQLFLQKNYEEARKVWLSARARYGTNFDYHRRNDYFISLAFLKISNGIFQQFGGNFYRPEVRLTYSNTATFLSWAFIKKNELKDDALEKITPRNLYNLAAIYFLFDRFNGAHATAREGLNFLRKTGRKEFRGQFRRIIAEGWIKSNKIIDAFREFDTVIRLERDPELAAKSFERMGDIYFDLNNYELAEDSYKLSQGIGKQIQWVSPLSYILRGESLFWLGKFQEAQKSLQFGIDSNHHRYTKQTTSDLFRSWAQLRIADAFFARSQLAQKNGNFKKAKKLKEDAVLAYFKVKHQFPKYQAAAIADIRCACLSLPKYKGQNIRHARNLLKEIKDKPLPLKAWELAQSCYLLSTSSQEKEIALLDDIREYKKNFPKSKMLPKFIEPSMEIKAKYLDQFIQENEYYKAIKFYEKEKNELFQELSDYRALGLFRAYVITNQSGKASDFWWRYYQSKPFTELDKLIMTTYFLESKTQELDLELNEKESEWRRVISGKTQKIEENSINRNLVARIIYAKNNLEYLPWLLDMISHWSVANTSVLCELEIPLLSNWALKEFEKNNVVANEVWIKLQKIISERFPGLFERSLTCSEGILNFELNLALKGSYIKEYANNWLERVKWGRKKITLPLMMQAVQNLSDDNRDESALRIQLLKFISEQNKMKYKESVYATKLLEKNHLESEKLWK